MRKGRGGRGEGDGSVGECCTCIMDYNSLPIFRVCAT